MTGGKLSGITKTIPQKDGIEAVEALYDGRIGEFEFHMAGQTITSEGWGLRLYHLAGYDRRTLPDHPH